MPLLRSAPLPTATLAAIVRDVAGHPEQWRHRVRFTDDERWWTLLSREDDVEVWLLTWQTGSTTELHDHGRSAAAFGVVTGRLHELRAVGGHLTTTRLETGEVATVAPGVVHDVRNCAAAPAVSIHAYSPPLSSMTFYASNDTGLQPVRTVATHEPEPSQS